MPATSWCSAVFANVQGDRVLLFSKTSMAYDKIRTSDTLQFPVEYTHGGAGFQSTPGMDTYGRGAWWHLLWFCV